MRYSRVRMDRATVAEELKTHFNEAGTGMNYASYEERRWSQNERTRVQKEATERFISSFAVPYFQDKKPHTVLELGPGPGTWTALLAKHFPQAKFVLADISKEMLRRTQELLGSRVIDVAEGDFLTVSLPHTPYDVFFSSRALEYLGDSERVIEKISTTLVGGGKGCIITKMPKILLKQLRGQSSSSRHQGQIRPHILKRLLQNAGCTDITLYPVTCSVPVFKSALLDNWCTTFFAKTPLNFLSAFFAESYGVLFTKS